jgi:hypothetical protein
LADYTRRVKKFEALNELDGTGKRKTKPKYPVMEKQLHDWFLAQKRRNVTIDGNILKKKAFQINLSLGNNGFNASNGWFNWTRFKGRLDLRDRPNFLVVP